MLVTLSMMQSERRMTLIHSSSSGDGISATIRSAADAEAFAAWLLHEAAGGTHATELRLAGPPWCGFSQQPLRTSVYPCQEVALGCWPALLDQLQQLESISISNLWLDRPAYGPIDQDGSSDDDSDDDDAAAAAAALLAVASQAALALRPVGSPPPVPSRQLLQLSLQRCQLAGWATCLSNCSRSLSRLAGLTSLSLAGSYLHPPGWCSTGSSSSSSYDGKGVRRACQLIGARLTRLTALDMSDHDLCDAELAELGRLHLTQLRLHHGRQQSTITPHGLEQHLSGRRGSCVVSLCVHSADDERLATWLACHGSNLQQLQLCSASVARRCPCRLTEDVRGRQRLQYGRILRREVAAAPLSSHLLAALAGLPLLDDLLLCYFDFGEEPGLLATLAALRTRLTRLVLVDIELCEAQDFAVLLAGLGRLRELEVRPCPHRPSHCQVRWCLEDLVPQGWQALAAVPGLTRLDVGQASAPPAVLQQLGRLSQLRGLVVAPVGDTTRLSWLTGLTGLTQLDLHAGGQQGGSTSQALVHLKALVVLRLRGGCSLQPADALLLTRLTRLQLLDGVCCSRKLLQRHRWCCGGGGQTTQPGCGSSMPGGASPRHEDTTVVALAAGAPEARPLYQLLLEVCVTHVLQQLQAAATGAGVALLLPAAMQHQLPRLVQQYRDARHAGENGAGVYACTAQRLQECAELLAEAVLKLHRMLQPGTGNASASAGQTPLTLAATCWQALLGQLQAHLLE